VCAHVDAVADPRAGKMRKQAALPIASVVVGETQPMIAPGPITQSRPISVSS
jgi:hypothetical protein